MGEYFFIIALTLAIGASCAKNKPEKYILGQWEVQEIYLASNKEDTQLAQDFKVDLYYFENVIFYENKEVYIHYLHVQPKLGTYTIKPSISDSKTFTLGIEHFPLKDSTFQQKFDFDNSFFSINKLTRNKLTLELTSCPCADGIYKKFIMDLKKTGKF